MHTGQDPRCGIMKIESLAKVVKPSGSNASTSISAVCDMRGA